MRLYSGAVHWGVEAAGVRLHAIGGSGAGVGESGYPAVQEDAMRFNGFPFHL